MARGAVALGVLSEFDSALLSEIVSWTEHPHALCCSCTALAALSRDPFCIVKYAGRASKLVKALHWAAKTAGQTELLRMLLAQANVAVNAKNKGGYTPLMLACASGHESAVKLLLAHPSLDINLVGGWTMGFLTGTTALRTTVTKNQHSMLQLLLEQPAIHDHAEGPSALQMASRHSVPLLKTLISWGAADVYNFEVRQGLLRDKCESGGIDVVAALLQTGSRADMDEDGDTPLLRASRGGHADIIRLLLAHGAGVGRQVGRCLAFAAGSGRTEAVAALLDQPHAAAAVHCQNHVGPSPLYVAAQAGHAEVVAMLLASSAWADSGTLSHALSAATSQGHASVVKVLLETGRGDLYV